MHLYVRAYVRIIIDILNEFFSLFFCSPRYCGPLKFKVLKICPLVTLSRPSLTCTIILFTS